jgi:hypothetical protein
LVKVKNVRPGILIIADAGLKLAPGETVSLEKTTPQIDAAIEVGLLARVESDAESRPRPKSNVKPIESKSGSGEAAKTGGTGQSTISGTDAGAVAKTAEAGQESKSTSGAQRSA